MAPQRAEEVFVLRLDHDVGEATGERACRWGVLRDHVVVFTTRLGANDGPEATLLPWPGARTYLPIGRQATAGADFRPELVLEEEDGVVRQGAWVIGSTAPPLRAAGRPVRVGDVPTTGCPLPALSRHAMLTWLRRRIAPEADPVRFRTLLAGDRRVRGAVASALERGFEAHRARRRSRAA